MSAHKHTPGPWQYNSKSISGCVRAANGAGVAIAAGNGDVMHTNGYLIAAAPDLLEAARAAAKSHMMYGKVMMRDIEELLTAITKAHGGAA